MSSSNEASTLREQEARLLQLSEEIEQLRVDLARKLDEAEALVKRIGLVGSARIRPPR